MWKRDILTFVGVDVDVVGKGKSLGDALKGVPRNLRDA